MVDQVAAADYSRLGLRLQGNTRQKLPRQPVRLRHQVLRQLLHRASRNLLLTFLGQFPKAG